MRRLSGRWPRLAQARNHRYNQVYVGLELIGRMLWLESDEAWDHTPELEGFRPMLGMR
jgi:hypothetical protein